jgi:CheY-like chemotaxis protein
MSNTRQAAALVVEDDETQREMVVVLLEELELKVFACESGEAATMILQEIGDTLCLMFTDVNLRGPMNGIELASRAKVEFPRLKVIVTSGRPAPNLPTGMTFMQKPWQPLDLLREAKAVC